MYVSISDLLDNTNLGIIAQLVPSLSLGLSALGCLKIAVILIASNPQVTISNLVDVERVNLKQFRIHGNRESSQAGHLKRAALGDIMITIAMISLLQLGT